MNTQKKPSPLMAYSNGLALGSLIMSLIAILSGTDGEWDRTIFTCAYIDQDGVKDCTFTDGSGNLIITNSQGEKLSYASRIFNIDSFVILPLNKGRRQLITTNGKAINAYRFSEESTTSVIQ